MKAAIDDGDDQVLFGLPVSELREFGRSNPRCWVWGAVDAREKISTLVLARLRGAIRALSLRSRLLAWRAGCRWKHQHAVNGAQLGVFLKRRCNIYTALVHRGTFFGSRFVSSRFSIISGGEYTAAAQRLDTFAI
ncbi:hypothetical protein F6P93_10470 [Escherichia coli]|nr:hypothetical protein F6P93_10470 [Escherichia coli]